MHTRYTTDPSNGTTTWSVPPVRRPTQEYMSWKNLMSRVNNSGKGNFLRNPSYADVSVSEDWLLFENFSNWFCNNKYYGSTDALGKIYHLDKDWKIPKNKRYSPESCLILPRAVNNFLNFSRVVCPKGFIGAFYREEDFVWQSSIKNGITNKVEWLGQYKDAETAHIRWKHRKIEIAHELSQLYTEKEVEPIVLHKLENFGDYIDDYL